VINTAPVTTPVEKPEPTVTEPVVPVSPEPVLIVIVPLVIEPSAVAVDNTMLPVDAFP
jgi:hypothetical protein